MSLDITLYSKNGEPPATIDCDEKFYERLIKSDFSEIGISHKKEFQIEGENTEISVIELDKGRITNRQRLIDFFKEEIVEESKEMLIQLGDFPSKEEYQEKTYFLKKLQEILQHLENKEYCYLSKTS